MMVEAASVSTPGLNMAVILIDSCIVTDLADPESTWFEWSASTLERLDQNNTLVINPIIYAECSVGFAECVGF